MLSKPIPILLYHCLGAEPGATPVAVFREHMQYLAKSQIISITPAELEAVLTGSVSQQRTSVLISFDDGSRDLLTKALPVLQEYGLVATAFLITGRMRGGKTYPEPNKNALSWDEANVLKESGNFSLHSHSHTHSRWPLNGTSSSALSDELLASRDTLATELGMSIATFTHLAWPWGRCTPDFEALAMQHGYSYQYLVQKGAITHPGCKTNLPRLCCDQMPTAVFKHWINALTNPVIANPLNFIFGSIRKMRHGSGYQ